MVKLTDSNQQEWQPVRPELTSGISGKVLQDGPIKMVLTKVAPGGVFHLHQDKYGEGIFEVQGEEHRLGAGMTLQIKAGGMHGYKNCGQEDLLLISVNVPVG
jgi:quercetin dioxygenase-like cupin family protein